ncbi:DUF6527 family protein [Mesorhizobium sp. M0522]|uniref:DUF6527 family protein n=1 Tax=Mesorhizobium sp. M0522 TaxID=2956958 RepID=UPI00333E14D2
MNDIRLQKVHFVPKELDKGVLYVSDEYQVAVHLCACGCGCKVAIPLGPAEWRFTERGGRPSLQPSIGSGQLPCNSHYIIRDGRILWEPKMTAAQTVTGMLRDERRRQAYYEAHRPLPGFFASVWQLVRRLFGL